MDVRLARFVAIAVVLAVLGGLMLGTRAKKLERQLVTNPPVVDTQPEGPPDSARAVALAVHAYRLDHSARAEVAVPVRVTSFTTDSAGFVIELAPRDSVPGTRAVVRVLRTGEVELRRLTP